MKCLFLLSIVCVPTFAAMAQQPDLTLVPYRDGVKWGYASPDKKLMIKPVFGEAGWFYSGYAAVKKGVKYGYIDRAGKVVIPYKFTVAKPFRYGYISNSAKKKEDTVLFAGASVRADGYEICINTKGMRMARCPAINENSAAENHKPDIVTKQKTYTLTSANGLFDSILDDYSIADSTGTYYIGTKNNLAGIFSNEFQVLVPFEYNSLKKVAIGTNNYLIAEKNGMAGLLNGIGTALIPVENSSLHYVRARNGNDYFIISKDGSSWVTNIANKNIFPVKYAAIEYDGDAGFVLTGPNKLKGYYFLNDQIIEPRYAEVKLSGGGKYLLVKTQSGKMGFVNSGGEEFFKE